METKSTNIYKKHGSFYSTITIAVCGAFNRGIYSSKYQCTQVRDTLYRPHRSLFIRDSSWFASRIDKSIVTESRTVDSTPDIVLDPAITTEEFEAFLSVLYPAYVVILSGRRRHVWLLTMALDTSTWKASRHGISGPRFSNWPIHGRSSPFVFSPSANLINASPRSTV